MIKDTQLKAYYSGKRVSEYALKEMGFPPRNEGNAKSYNAKPWKLSAIGEAIAKAENIKIKEVKADG